VTRKTRWTEAEAAEALAGLTASWPGWRFWHVPGGPYGDLFCGCREDQEQPVLHGFSPPELTQHIAEYTDDALTGKD
jgi:hypothetical protein